MPKYRIHVCEVLEDGSERKTDKEIVDIKELAYAIGRNRTLLYAACLASAAQVIAENDALAAAKEVRANAAN